MTNLPSFLQSDDSEVKDAISSLSDDALDNPTPPADDTKPVDINNSDNPLLDKGDTTTTEDTTDTKPNEDKPAEGETEPKPGDKNVLKDEEKPTNTKPADKPADKQPEVKVDEKPVIDSPDEILIRSSERALERAKEMTGQLTQAQQSLMKNPVVSVSIPDIKGYAQDDGTLDIESYMQDYTKNLIMAIQGSLAGGPLAALMYGTLHTALLEDYGNTVAEGAKTTKSSKLQDQIVKEFPIFGKDEALAETFGAVVVQKWNKHVQESKTKNEDPGKVTLDWVKKVANDFLKSMKIDVNANHTPDPAERIHGGPNLNGNDRKPMTSSDEDVQAVDQLLGFNKKKSLF